MAAGQSGAQINVEAPHQRSLPAVLEHPFRAVIFDWDGTAVVDRREDATALITVAEALLRLRVWLAVVTGTNFGHIDRQFCSRLDAGRTLEQDRILDPRSGVL